LLTVFILAIVFRKLNWTKDGNLNEVHTHEKENGKSQRLLDVALNRHFQDVVEAKRKVMRISKYIPCESTVSKVLREISTSFFTEVREHIPHSETVLFTSSINVRDDFVKRKTYSPASNNCHLLETSYLKNSVFKNDCTSHVDIPPFKLPLYKNNDRYPVIEERRVIWTHLHVLSHATVNNDGDVICERTKIVPNRCWAQNRSTTTCFKVNSESKYDELFTISQFWGSNFFHGTLENLPRLALYLSYLRANPQIKIHVAAIHPFLSYLGLDEDRFVFGTVHARILYMPSGGSCGGASSIRLQYLSDQLRNYIPHQPSGYSIDKLHHSPNKNKRDSIIVIQRTTKRWFRYHDEIIKMIHKQARLCQLKAIVFGDDTLPSVEVTRDIFRRALIVIAPHGAGESNLILSDPGTVLIEALCRDRFGRLNLCYQGMALALGIRYYGLISERSCNNITASDLEIPLTKYLKLLSCNV